MSRPAARRTFRLTLAGILMILGLVWWMSDSPPGAAPAPETAIDAVGPAGRATKTVPEAPPRLPRQAPTPVEIPDGRETVVLDVRSSAGEPVHLIEVSDALTGERLPTAVTDDGLTVRCDGAHGLVVRAPRHFGHAVPADVVDEHQSTSAVLECTLVAAYRFSGTSQRSDGRAGWEEALLGADPREFDLDLDLIPVDEQGPLEKGQAWFDGTWFEDDTLTIQGITHGEYVVDLDFGPHEVQLSRHATISDEVERLEFALSSLGTGSLLVEVVDRDDAPFGGVVHLELQRPDGRHVWDHQFDAAPFVMPVLRPGTYQVSMTHAYAGEGDYPSARSEIIEVAAGARTTVRLAFDQMN